MLVYNYIQKLIKVHLTYIIRNFSQEAKNLKSPETMEVKR